MEIFAAYATGVLLTTVVALVVVYLQGKRQG
jgi:hypothetical protein